MSFVEANRNLPPSERTTAVEPFKRGKLSLSELVKRAAAELHFNCEPSLAKKLPLTLPHNGIRSSGLVVLREFLYTFIGRKHFEASMEYGFVVVERPGCYALSVLHKEESSLALAMGVLPLVVCDGKAACVHYVAKSAAKLLPSEALVAGLYRGGVFSRSDVEEMNGDLSAIDEAVNGSGYKVMLVIDEAQRLFKRKSLDINGDIRNLANPRGSVYTILTSDCASLWLLLYRPQVLEARMFPAKPGTAYKESVVREILSCHEAYEGPIPTVTLKHLQKIMRSMPF